MLFITLYVLLLCAFKISTIKGKNSDYDIKNNLKLLSYKIYNNSSELFSSDPEM